MEDRNQAKKAPAGGGGARRISGQVVASLLVVSGVLIMLATLQRQLIYFPQVGSEQDLLANASAIGLRDWRDDAGQLIGWHSGSQGDDARRVLVFHGNAGYALHRDYYVAGFLEQKQDWDIYLFEYPGYGARPGRPSEDEIKATAEAAVKLLLGADARPLYLVGESLGSGVASHLAAAFPEQVGGVLLVTPFTSLADVAAHHYSFLPVRSLLLERYDSAEALSHYRGPVAFLLAGSDEIVPSELGQRLYEGYAGPRWLRVQSGAGHNSLNFYPSADWWGDAVNFLTSGRE